jgi:hypothetical protein
MALRKGKEMYDEVEQNLSLNFATLQERFLNEAAK